MATTTISGAVSTTGPLSNELPVNMRDQIAFLDVDDSQFTTMLMDPQLGKGKITSPKAEWLNF